MIYASTRPFDDPQLLVQTQWEPLVPHVTINLYQEGTAADGSMTLTLVDTTQTSSWDDWAQGFRKNAAGTAYMTSTQGAGTIPNMNCPGQDHGRPVLFTLYNQPEYLDLYNNVLHGTATATTPLAVQLAVQVLRRHAQLEPAAAGALRRHVQLPERDEHDPATGRPTGTNCTICAQTPNPAKDLYAGTADAAAPASTWSKSCRRPAMNSSRKRTRTS